MFIIVLCYSDFVYSIFVACPFSLYVFFFFKQKTAYEMRISDWSSDVCSSDLASRICRWACQHFFPLVVCGHSRLPSSATSSKRAAASVHCALHHLAREREANLIPRQMSARR